MSDCCEDYGGESTSPDLPRSPTNEAEFKKKEDDDTCMLKLYGALTKRVRCSTSGIDTKSRNNYSSNIVMAVHDGHDPAIRMAATRTNTTMTMYGYEQEPQPGRGLSINLTQ
ncbi:hypothetical protein Droror1_Dr00001416 [Drosera rotundifolia]